MFCEYTGAPCVQCGLDQDPGGCPFQQIDVRKDLPGIGAAVSEGNR